MTVLSFASFSDKLRILSDSFDLSEGDIRTARTRGGLLVRSENAARLWGGSISLVANRVENLREIRALLNQLQEVDQFFQLTDTLAKYPAGDPTGSLLGSSTPTLSAVSTDGKTVAIAGLPSGYVLAAGDRFAFSYGSSPTRYAYHEIASGATATSGGAATGIRVVPAIRPGYATGAAVDFKKPRLLAAMVPGSIKLGARSLGVGEGASFSWIQSLNGS